MQPKIGKTLTEAYRYLAKSSILFSACSMLARHSVCNHRGRISFPEESAMPKLVRIVIQLPMDLKTRLDGLKQQGYTTSGFIRAMLERELAKIDQEVPEQKSLTLVTPVKRANSR